MKKIIPLAIVASLFLLLDLYVFEVIRVLVRDPSLFWWAQVVFWAFNFLAIGTFFAYHFTPIEKIRPGWRNALLSSLLITYFAKFFVLIFLVLDDMRRLFMWSGDQLTALWDTQLPAESIDNPRSGMLAKAGLMATAIPIGAMTYGVAIGAHDYRVVRKKIHIPNLPAGMEGLTIGQISDIHSGSLYSRRGVMKGVDRLLNESPDLICFTGDLVNNRTEEIEHTFDLFEQVKAPLGVYSILGNHDYGNYAQWENAEEKARNLELLKQTHAWLGWDLLLDEHRVLPFGEHSLALAGVENWGASSRMPKYGNLDMALQGTENADVRLVLSHDPSHWKAQILNHTLPVDLTLSGHTHGMQFGVHTKRVKWSPVQYHIKHWAGLYEQEKQYLYVNRGFGFHGFPGRIGMPPEITILSLTGTPTHGRHKR